MIDLIFILFLAQNQMRLCPWDLSLRGGGGGDGGGGLARRGGARRRRRIVHQGETTLAPRSPNRVRNVVVSWRVVAMAALFVQGALTVLVIWAALDAHISAGNAAFEHAPEKTVSSCTRRHIVVLGSISRSLFFFSNWSIFFWSEYELIFVDWVWKRETVCVEAELMAFVEWIVFYGLNWEKRSPHNGWFVKVLNESGKCGIMRGFCF